MSQWKQQEIDVPQHKADICLLNICKNQEAFRIVKVDQKKKKKKSFKSGNEIPRSYRLPGNQENVLQGKILQFSEKQI